MEAAADAPHRRLQGAGRAAPDPAPEVLPVPRRRRLRALPGRSRLRQAWPEALGARILRAVEPAALRSVRALHRSRPVAHRLQELPRQPGPLPAQHRRLMRRTTRYVVPAVLALLLAGCSDAEREPETETITPSNSP